jgi:hypothetical protein
MTNHKILKEILECPYCIKLTNTKVGENVEKMSEGIAILVCEKHMEEFGREKYNQCLVIAFNG